MPGAFQHPALGMLVPKSHGKVDQFLGLQYAYLKDRFAAPELFFSASSQVIDATNYGPSVISPSIGCQLEFGFIQQSLPRPVFTSSELDGLNLNVTVPSGIPSGAKLPVLVFIHGGGFAIGGNSWPQYDAVKLVEMAVEQSKPIIAININYRVGVFGFLTSEELRNKGYVGNNGLRDQQVAFEWIRNNIAGFGGDPDNITVGGESAGGVCTTLHLYSKKPQFAHAISMGGTALLMKPLPPLVHEKTYKTVLELLGISAPFADERVAALLNMPVEEILAKIPPDLPLHPIFDGELIPVPLTFKSVGNLKDSSMPGKHWCKSLLIGNNQLDASILVGALETREGTLINKFITSITKHLAPHAGVADALLKSYGMSTSMSDTDALFAILRFASDIGFFAPTLTFAEGFPGEAYVYCFNEPNPWEGRFKGHASHVLDVAFFFQNYNDLLDAAQAKSAWNFATDIIKFVRGEAPWTPYEKGTSVARVYGPSAEGGEAVLLESAVGNEAKTKRNMKLFDFSRKPGLDVISAAFDMFVAGQ